MHRQQLHRASTARTDVRFSSGTLSFARSQSASAPRKIPVAAHKGQGESRAGNARNRRMRVASDAWTPAPRRFQSQTTLRALGPPLSYSAEAPFQRAETVDPREPETSRTNQAAGCAEWPRQTGRAFCVGVLSYRPKGFAPGPLPRIDYGD
jgi:hypothetical protein